MMSFQIHLQIFFEVSVFVLYAFSSYLLLCGLLQHWRACLIVAIGLFGILCRFRIRKPENSRLKRVLGCEWGAYEFISQVEKCEDGDDDFYVKVIGHRACGLDAPENSISALNKMFQKGIPVVEFDVVLTADHIPIVFHDSNLYRITNSSKNVSEMMLDEIKTLDISVKHPFGKNFPCERIPTLYEYVCICIAKNIRMIIDIKESNKKMVQIINNLFKEFPELYDLAIISSFDPILIYRIRAKDPNILGCLCWRPYFYSHEEYSGLKGPSSSRSGNPIVHLFQRTLNIVHQWHFYNLAYYFVGISVVLLAKDSVTREIIQYWGKRGIRIVAWSVNLPSEKNYFENNLQITYMTDTVINS